MCARVIQKKKGKFKNKTRLFIYLSAVSVIIYSINNKKKKERKKKKKNY